MTEPNDSEREAARVWADVVVATQDDGPPFPFIVQPHVWGFAAYVPLKATTLDEAIRDVWTARRGEYANVYALGLAARREEVERLTRERDAAIARAEKAEAEVARLREALVLAREVARDAHRQHHDVWDALDGLERVDDIARAALEPKP